MEQALSKIGEQGLTGALLVLALLAVIWLGKKLEANAEERLKESKEALLTIAAANQIMATLKDAVSGLATTLAALNSTVQTMHTENKSALEQARERDTRFEKQIEGVDEAIGEMDKLLSKIAGRDAAGR